jgi:hypothetical protein
VCFFSFNKNHPLRPKCPTLAVNSYFLIWFAMFST